MPTEFDLTACPYPDYGRHDDATPEVSDGTFENVPATGEGATGTAAAVWEALYAVEDPEMPVSIVDLGLIYRVAVEGGHVTVDMTLTYSGCPARSYLLEDVEAAVTSPDGIEDATVRLVYDPPWSVDNVTEPGRNALREFGLSV